MPKRKKGAIILDKDGPSSLFIFSTTNPIRWDQPPYVQWYKWLGRNKYLLYKTKPFRAIFCFKFSVVVVNLYLSPKYRDLKTTVYPPDPTSQRIKMCQWQPQQLTAIFSWYLDHATDIEIEHFWPSQSTNKDITFAPLSKLCLTTVLVKTGQVCGCNIIIISIS